MVAVVTLLELLDDRMLPVRCNRCGKEGRVKVSTLIRRYGAETAVPDALSRLALDGKCPKRGQAWDACFIVIGRGRSGTIPGKGRT